MEMIYLDYSATTPVDEGVIDTYSRVCREYIGNPNSLHKLGLDAKKLIDASTKQIASILGIKEKNAISNIPWCVSPSFPTIPALSTHIITGKF